MHANGRINPSLNNGRFFSHFTKTNGCMVGYFTVKGYTRKGGVLYGLKRFTDALKTYQEALKLDPNNKVTESFKY